MPAATVRRRGQRDLLFEEGAVETYLLSPPRRAGTGERQAENGALAAFTAQLQANTRGLPPPSHPNTITGTRSLTYPRTTPALHAPAGEPVDSGRGQDNS